MTHFMLAAAIVTLSLAGAAVSSFALLSCGLWAMAGLRLRRPRCRDWPLAAYLGTAFALGSGAVASLWLLLAIGHALKPLVVLAIVASSGLCGALLFRPVWR